MDIIKQMVSELQALEMRDPATIQDVLQKFSRSLDELQSKKEYDDLPEYIASYI